MTLDDQLGLEGPMRKVTITGAHGKAGRAAVAEFLAAGYEVLACDIAGPVGRNSDLGCPTMRVDLSDYGQCVQALDGADAVVHLANIPEPGMYPPAQTINANTAMNQNVFLAAAALRIPRVVWASSETTLGLPFGEPGGTLEYLPVDEGHYPHPASSYALSKVLGEAAAEQVARWSDTSFVGLRITNIFSEADYAKVPTFWAEPSSRGWNAFGYVDARDVALACRNAVEAQTKGSINLIIAAADSLMDRPSAELAKEVFPEVPVRGSIEGHQSLLSIDAAREAIGYQPQHSWRDSVSAGA
ncbi:nucleoside-diphosphate-sugar epimerase [Psychromicrobium silvestre]|uniref:Nucleoside-diphosphate-sugar epimerase n=1 Tax=Psychromicrobium silvestre TaxID=1645614 RepID=A0A7Y9LU96_9MICC|nr:NAD(P)-dependent oxidoreductase [Psychromicrobium silvestre]NYE95712.1 nucleoside-diphosphate-sugar epimerase [Psychromicrobium silvestre]